MSYRNVEMDTQSPKFKALYRSVIDAVAELTLSGEVEVKFLDHRALSVWRRRCYEYQKIVGHAFRIEVVDGHTLILRPTRRVVDAHPVTISGKPISVLRDEQFEDLADLPDLTPEQREIARKALEMVEGTEDHLTVDEIFGGSHDDTRGTEPGGDAASAGPPGGDDEDR